MTRNLRLIWTALLVSALASSGCKRATVAIYDVPKEANPSSEPKTAATLPNQNTPNGRIQWTKPDAWTELSPTAFRKGNYIVEGPSGAKTEITVSSFPGSVGGILANVNRWRGQASLSPITSDELVRSLTQISVQGQSGQFVDIEPESTDPSAIYIVAAIFLYGGESWFFKMSGPQEIVSTQVATFEQFVNGLVFLNTDPKPEAAAIKPTDGKLAFDVPAGWTESEGSSMRLASYEIVKDSFPSADFSITSFPGEAGGLSANVNRWRQQIGLPKWSDEQIQTELKTVKSDSFTFALFDLKPVTDDEKANIKERVLAAILKSDDRSWFYKLKGDVFLLETQRNKFRDVLLTSRFESSPGNNDL
jgi:hypothetical protein